MPDLPPKLDPRDHSPIRCAVIGGGISGLAAAFRLIELATAENQPIHVTVFEAADRSGGVFGTERIGEYLVERGADSFITSKPAGLKLCRRLGLEDRLIPTDSRFRSSLILSHGKPVPTPEGFQLVAAGNLKALLKSPLISWSGKLRVLAESLIPARRDRQDESVASFVRRRMGQEALDAIIQPLVGGIYTSDPEKLSAQATLQRFLKMEQDCGSLYRGMRPRSTPRSDSDSASGARYGLFVSFVDGMQELLSALQRQIQTSGEIRFSTRVDSLQQTDSGWELKTGTKREQFDGVVLALPPRSTSFLLSPLHRECAERIGQIESASSAIVLTGHPLSQIEHPMDSFGLVIPHREKRQILATSFLSRKFPGRAPDGKICLRTFVGGAMQPEALDRTDGEMIETVLKELRSIFGVTGAPDFAVVARYPQAMPQFTVGHLERVQEIRRLAGSLNRLTLAGNFFDGVGVPDCIQSGETAAEQVWQQLNSPAADFPSSGSSFEESPRTSRGA